MMMDSLTRLASLERVHRSDRRPLVATIIIIIVAATLLQKTAATTTVVNGGFEEGSSTTTFEYGEPTGWTTTGAGQSAYIYDGAAAWGSLSSSAGDYFIALQTQTTRISQTIATEVSCHAYIPHVCGHACTTYLI